MNSFGVNIKERRLTQRLSLRQLAAKSSVSASQILRIERGECDPKLSTARDIAMALGFQYISVESWEVTLAA